MHRLAAVALWLLWPLAAAAEAPPNIVFILADDMGYGDVRALNPGSGIPTPNLDRLAAEGMAFTDAHTPSAVCTPTRYGLLTGRYCWRSELKRGVLNGFSPPLLEKDRPTVASALRRRGYRTAVVGKWHMGLGWVRVAGGERNIDFSRPVTHGPNDVGFDYSYIIPASLDFPPYVFVRNGRVTQAPSLVQSAQKFPVYLRRGERSPDLVMEECLDHLLHQAQDYIRRQKDSDQPFFLYFPLTAPHKPVLPHSRFRGNSGLGPYGDFIVQVDWTVGQILNELAESGLANNTIVFYSSDNGSFMVRRDAFDARDHVDDATIQAFRADRHRANGEFRGTKADIWEAGHRVPFFVRWPGKIAPGGRSPDTICLTDFFATASELAGVAPGPNLPPDSFSFVPQLRGQSPDSPRPPVIHHSSAGMFAIREGNLKLVLGNGSGGREKPRGKPFQRPYHLSDLREDIQERHNLADSRPQDVARLEQAADRIRQPLAAIRIYVGTYTHGDSEGIYALEMDPISGALTSPKLVVKSVNPSFLAIHPSRRFLYAVNEVDRFNGQDGGGISAYSIDSSDASLTLLNAESSRGEAPCHLVVDRAGRNVLVANYGGGNVAVLPIRADGSVGVATALVQHQGSGPTTRQAMPHAHAIHLDAENRHALAVDLGLDKVLVYRFQPENGTLLPHDPPSASVLPGSGPRHLALHPNRPFAFVINELQSTVTVFRYDARQGVLAPIQSISTLPAGFGGSSYTAEVLVHPSGRFLYGSNRGDDSIAVFAIDRESGRLQAVEFEPTQGQIPRNFGSDPAGRFLVVANQKSDNLVVFRIDEETGALDSAGHQISVPHPVCVRFLPTWK